MKALRLCESFHSSSSGYFSQQSSRKLDHRLFSIHHRLASLYHNSYRNQVKCPAHIHVMAAFIFGFHSRDETAMSVYKTMAKCRSSFA